jgi:transcriptional regulator with GAF, ATPase, and Fis domain
VGPVDSTRIIGAGPTAKLVGAEIIVIDGPDTGARLRLENMARIGTAPSNDLRLTDPTVSRLHVEMRVVRGGIAVRDAESTNGTTVDGMRVGEVTVGAGATVRIGETTLRVELGDEPMYVDVSSATSFGDVIGASVEMRRVFAILERAAPTDATLLLQGETGTGKDLVARAVHAASGRADGPFVAVDCGAIAENLVESELFGHVRGAFSGATSDRRGAFEEAEGGTLFFDEIGELPLALQPKLLRALEAREVRRVGSNTVRRVNVRVVAATHRHLPAAVNAGTFREDLYYRLAVVTVEIPPLRARREDVPLIAQHFYARFRGKDEKLPAPLLANVLAREWRGNVRELRNFVERAVSVGGAMPMPAATPPSSPSAAQPASLESYVATHLPLREARDAWDAAFERAYVRGALERAGGNVTRAAELAGVNRRYFQRMMVRAGLRSAAADDDDE